MQERTAQLMAALQQAGYRLTPQRMAICEVLATSDEHPSSSGVYERVKARFPTVSRATVYNTLNALRDLGEIVEIGLGRSEKHYEPNLTPHANLICLQCGRIDDLANPSLLPLQEQVAAASGFAVKNARFDVYGICPQCQEAQRNA